MLKLERQPLLNCNHENDPRFKSQLNSIRESKSGWLQTFYHFCPFHYSVKQLAFGFAPK